MLSGQEVVVIDWSNAHVGNAFYDVARTFLLLQSPIMPPGTPFYMKMMSIFLKRIMEKVYVREYLRLSGGAMADIDAWLLPVAAARLREDAAKQEYDWLMKIIAYDGSIGVMV